MENEALPTSVTSGLQSGFGKGARRVAFMTGFDGSGGFGRRSTRIRLLVLQKKWQP